MMVTSVQNRCNLAPDRRFGLWCAGVTVWARRLDRDSADRRFLLYCLAAALSLISFYTVYLAHDAFMFSGHVWPYVMAPGVLAGMESLRKRHFFAALCIATAVVLSAMQHVIGLRMLGELPGNTGASVARCEPRDCKNSL
jgi:hypothetical protein